MDGAARSGKQNIVEGSEGMQTSLKSAIKLTGVAKASFEELIGDLEDYLRQNNLKQFPKNNPKIEIFRQKAAVLIKKLSDFYKNESLVRNLSNLSYLEKYFNTSSVEEKVNLLLTLCHQETFLLNKQVLSLEEKHKTEGGLTEKLYKARVQHRGY